MRPGRMGPLSPRAARTSENSAATPQWAPSSNQACKSAAGPTQRATNSRPFRRIGGSLVPNGGKAQYGRVRQKWEYMTWVVGYGHIDDTEYFGHRGGRVKAMNGEAQKNWKNGAMLDAWLKWAGEEGWELIEANIPGGRHSWGGGVRVAEESSDAFYIFKRPVDDMVTPSAPPRRDAAETEQLGQATSSQ